MKKLLLAALVFISLHTYAQKIRVGLTTGMSVSNYRSKVDGKTESGDAKAGFTAGLLLDLAVAKHFSFQPALNFVQKGSKSKNNFAGTTYKSSFNINYIEMPLNFLYNTRGKAGNFFVGAGPSVAIALNGRSKFSDGTTAEEEHLKFGSGEDDFIKSIDMGANFITGFSLKNGIMFAVNYNAGLNNLFPHGNDDGRLKSSYWGIKLGYLLNTGRRK